MEPTLFDWQKSTIGFESPQLWRDFQSSNYNRPEYSNSEGDVFATLVDMNNDLLPDRVAESRYDSAGEKGLWVYLNNGSGFDDPTNWWTKGTGSEQHYPTSNMTGGTRHTLIDMNRDGLPDRVSYYNYDYTGNAGYGLWIALNNGSGFDEYTNWYAFAGIGSWKSSLAQHRESGYTYRDLVDMNNDRLPDRVEWRREDTKEEGLIVRINNGSGFNAPVNWWRWPLFGTESFISNTNNGGEQYTISDMNGDGLPDKVNYYSHLENPKRYGTYVYINNGSGFDDHKLWFDTQNKYYSRFNYSDGTGHYNSYMDINGDGILDRLSHKDPTNNSISSLWAKLGNGNGFEAEYKFFETPSNNHFNKSLYRGGSLSTIYQMFIDLTGDGLPEKVARYKAPSFSSGEQTLWVAPNSGSALGASNDWWEHSSLNGTQYPIHRDSGGKFSDFVDMNGDGVVDRVTYKNYINEAAGLHVALGKSKPELITAITNGHGHETSIEYTNLMDKETYTKDTDAEFPILDVRGPTPIVKNYSVDDGIGGKAKTSFKYTGLKAHLQGLGMCGFRQMEVTNELSGIRTVTYYHQDFPYKSLPHMVKTYLADGTLINEVSDTWSVKNFDYDSYFPHVSSSIVKDFELDGSLVKQQTTTKSFDDYGNVTELVVSQLDGHSTTTSNTYQYISGFWYMDRLSETEVTKVIPGQAPVTKRALFEYNQYTGQLDREVSNTQDFTQSLEKRYVHDYAGNIVESTTYDYSQSPFFPVSVQKTTYDENMQFATESENMLLHKETKTYDSRHGKVDSHEGPNGIVTQWEFDGFGRPYYEYRANGTKSRTVQRLVADGDEDAPEGAVYYIQTDATGVAPTKVYHDVLDRELRRVATGLNNKTIYADKMYNNLGQLYRESDPYFKGEMAYWKIYRYDILDRMVLAQSRDNDGRIVRERIGYSGLMTTTQNGLGQTSTRVENSVGKLIKTIDNDQNETHFEYDGDGNLTKVTDSDNNITTAGFDVSGNKLWMIDPDSGRSEYKYNVLGQLLEQKDARNEVITFEYDDLGRMTRRVDEEEETLWTYDTAPGKGVGKLASVSYGSDYERRLIYDQLGRVSHEQTIVDNTSYVIQQSYDFAGRVDTMTYPQGAGINFDFPDGFKVRNIYSEDGHLERVESAGFGETQIYWEALTANARGQLEEQQLGNGLLTTRAFNQYTGFLEGIHTTRGAQDLSYGFDSIGNITFRDDASRCARERFTYDSLNRLRSSTLTSCNMDSDPSLGASSSNTTSVRYDKLGNITYKSDVGNYTYGENGAGPHAVTSIIGQESNTYQYDPSGNRIASDFDSVTYSSYGKPLTMTKENIQLEFSYGPERARYKQVKRKDGAVEKTKYYVGGLYEKEIKGTNEKHVYYIKSPSGTVAIRSEKNNGGGEDILYLLKDHLGSVDTITNSLGYIVEQLSFDAWGKRRNSDWTPATSLVSSEIDRGFTGHEHLDAVGLIHMNGRVYDPTIGRFLSPDPFVQAPENSQSLNRYSYVLNNPLSYTDPSGFFFKKIFKAIKKAVKKVVSFVKQHKAIIAAAVIGFATGLWIAGLTAKFGAFASAVLAGAAGGAAGSFSAAVVSGARFSDALKAGFRGGVFGGISGGVFNQIGGNLVGLERILAHGGAGGALNMAQGGKFEHGFISSFAVAALGGPIGSIDSGNAGVNIYRTAVASFVGGAVAEVTGGKFANGAITAAFARMFNDDDAAHQNYQKYAKQAKGLNLKLSPSSYMKGAKGLNIDLPLMSRETPIPYDGIALIGMDGYSTISGLTQAGGVIGGASSVFGLTSVGYNANSFFRNGGYVNFLDTAVSAGAVVNPTGWGGAIAAANFAIRSASIAVAFEYSKFRYGEAAANEALKMTLQ